MTPAKRLLKWLSTRLDSDRQWLAEPKSSEACAYELGAVVAYVLAGLEEICAEENEATRESAPYFDVKRPERAPKIDPDFEVKDEPAPPQGQARVEDEPSARTKRGISELLDSQERMTSECREAHDRIERQRKDLAVERDRIGHLLGALRKIELSGSEWCSGVAKLAREDDARRASS